MTRRSLVDPINEQIERARIDALRNRPDIPADETFAIDVQVRVYAESWPGRTTKRSRSRVVGSASCVYVPRTTGTEAERQEQAAIKAVEGAEDA